MAEPDSLTVEIRTDLAAAIATCNDVHCACEVVGGVELDDAQEQALWWWLTSAGERGEA